MPSAISVLAVLGGLSLAVIVIGPLRPLRGILWFTAMEQLILIPVARSYEEDPGNVYDAGRGVWRVSKANAERYDLILAHCRGIVRGAFRPTHWLTGTKANFPWQEDYNRERIGFEGNPAEREIQSLYVGKRIPEEYRARGASNPVR